MKEPSDFQNNGWFLYNEDSPAFVRDHMPAKPRLGEHRCKVETLSQTSVMFVWFNNDRTPEAFMVTDHPENVWFNKDGIL